MSRSATVSLRREIDVLEAATNELHRLCLEVVQQVIDRHLFARFRIPERCVPLILSSWEREDLSLYGRFDLFYDGQQPPRMYEYNADTPTSLLEASVVQWDWLQKRSPQFDQFNSIHEKLIARWQESGWQGEIVHFACVRDHLEDFATTVYMEDTAMQAGLGTRRLFMDEIGWDGRSFRGSGKPSDQEAVQIVPLGMVAGMSNSARICCRSLGR